MKYIKLRALKLLGTLKATSNGKIFSEPRSNSSSTSLGYTSSGLHNLLVTIPNINAPNPKPVMTMPVTDPFFPSVA